MKRAFILLFFMLGCLVIESKAQKIAVKSNLLYDATTTVNLGLEFGLARKWTLDIPVNYNPWKPDNGRRLRHWGVQPEVRYWFCETSHKHFIGLHIPYLLYNVSDIKLLGTESERHQGWGAGAGLSYGYSWLLSKHWNLEATLGVGYLYLETEKYPCANCGTKSRTEKKHYFGPTQAAVNLIYQF